jgi:2-haloacid dehalogenase
MRSGPSATSCSRRSLRLAHRQGGSGIDAVVFDLGGVLIDWNPRHLYRKLFNGDEVAMERFLAEVCSPAWNAEQDSGRPWHVAVAELARAYPEQRHLIEAYDQRWDEMLGGAIEGTVEILADLRATGLRLAALSNWSAEKFPVARRRYGFLDWFDPIVISGEVGMSKPDERIYRYLLDATGLDPGTTLFIDDSPVNVAAAVQLGMSARLFTDPACLGADLEAMGLLATVSSPRPPDR